MRFRRGRDALLRPVAADARTNGTVVPSPPVARAELELVALHRRVTYLEVQLEQADACIDDLLQRLFDSRAHMVAAIERATAEGEARDRAEARVSQV